MAAKGQQMHLEGTGQSRRWEGGGNEEGGGDAGGRGDDEGGRAKMSCYRHNQGTQLWCWSHSAALLEQEGFVLGL